MATKARADGASKGGKLKALKGQRARLNSAECLVKFTASVIHRVLDGEIQPDIGRCVLYGLNLQKALIESGDIDRRLAALEQRLEAAKPARRAW